MKAFLSKIDIGNDVSENNRFPRADPPESQRVEDSRSCDCSHALYSAVSNIP